MIVSPMGSALEVGKDGMKIMNWFNFVPRFNFFFMQNKIAPTKNKNREEKDKAKRSRMSNGKNLFGGNSGRSIEFL